MLIYYLCQRPIIDCCLGQGDYCCDNHHDQVSDIGRGGFVSLTVLASSSSSKACEQDSHSAGTWRQELIH